MLSRRSMLRAFGIGVPAAAVAAALPSAVVVPAPALAGVSGMDIKWSSAVHPAFAETIDVAELSAISGDLGPITAGKIVGEDTDFIIDFDAGIMDFG